MCNMLIEQLFFATSCLQFTTEKSFSTLFYHKCTYHNVYSKSALRIDSSSDQTTSLIVFIMRVLS